MFKYSIPCIVKRSNKFEDNEIAQFEHVVSYDFQILVESIGVQPIPQMHNNATIPTRIMQQNKIKIKIKPSKQPSRNQHKNLLTK